MNVIKFLHKNLYSVFGHNGVTFITTTYFSKEEIDDFHSGVEFVKSNTRMLIIQYT